MRCRGQAAVLFAALLGGCIHSGHPEAYGKSINELAQRSWLVVVGEADVAIGGQGKLEVKRVIKGKAPATLEFTEDHCNIDESRDRLFFVEPAELGPDKVKSWRLMCVKDRSAFSPLTADIVIVHATDPRDIAIFEKHKADLHTIRSRTASPELARQVVKEINWIGMTPAQVRRLLGNPAEEDDPLWKMWLAEGVGLGVLFAEGFVAELDPNVKVEKPEEEEEEEEEETPAATEVEEAETAEPDKTE